MTDRSKYPIKQGKSWQIELKLVLRLAFANALGEKTQKRIIQNLALAVARVATIEVYTIAGELNADELQGSGPRAPFRSGHSGVFHQPAAGEKIFDWLIEVGFSSRA